MERGSGVLGRSLFQGRVPSGTTQFQAESELQSHGRPLCRALNKISSKPYSEGRQPRGLQYLVAVLRRVLPNSYALDQSTFPTRFHS